MTANDDDPRASPELLAEMDVVRQMSDDEFQAALDSVSTAPSVDRELDLASRNEDDMVRSVAVARLMRRREG